MIRHRILTLAFTAGAFLAATCLASPTLHAEDTISLAHGAYLVNGIAACSSCHTPDDNGRPGPSLSGGKKLGGGANQILSPNITSDPETGIGSWTDAQLLDAIRNLRRPDGSMITALMPQTYRFMSDEDVKSIVLYIRSLPPVSNKVAAQVSAKSAETSHADVKSVASPDMTDPVKRGEYIADGLAHCSGCHTAVSASSPDFAARKNQGGRTFKIAAGTLVAPSLLKADLATYSDAELTDIITKGLRPDGQKIKGPMPISAYAKISAQDLSDLLLYLRHD